MSLLFWFLSVLFLYVRKAQLLWASQKHMDNRHRLKYRRFHVNRRKNLFYFESNQTLWAGYGITNPSVKVKTEVVGIFNSLHSLALTYQVSRWRDLQKALPTSGLAWMWHSNRSANSPPKRWGLATRWQQQRESNANISSTTAFQYETISVSCHEKKKIHAILNSEIWCEKNAYPEHFRFRAIQYKTWSRLGQVFP